MRVPVTELYRAGGDEWLEIGIPVVRRPMSNTAVRVLNITRMTITVDNGKCYLLTSTIKENYWKY